MTYTFLLAGFGGQGVLFAGKVAAYSGMLAGKEVTNNPCYGPAMRGGTADCSVIISDEQIGSPIVTKPSVLVVLNLPSFNKFEKCVEKGGTIIYDSSLINKEPSRDDVKYFGIPASMLANDNKLKGLANMIMLGKLVKEIAFTDINALKTGLQKSIPARKADLLEANLKAIDIGYNY